MSVYYGHVLILGGAVFVMGIFCVMTRRNLIMILLGIEIMLNGAMIVFVGASLRWMTMDGQVFVLFVLAIAATEVSVGLALAVCIYRRIHSLDLADYNLLGRD